MVLRIFLLLVVGLVLAADKPKENVEKEKPRRFYAKVEMKGVFEAPASSKKIARINVRPDKRRPDWFDVDVSQLKDWIAKDLDALTGQEVLVTGTLEIVNAKTPSGAAVEKMVIMAKTLKPLKAKGQARPKKSP